MITQIRRLLAPPVFEGDPDKTRTAWLLNIILLTLLARALFIRAITGSDPPRPSFVVPFVLLLLILMFVMRRGFVRFASAMTVVGFWLSLSAAAVITGGLHSNGFRNYILPVIVAGLILGRGGAIFTAALSIAAGLGMWAAEIYGLIEVPAESTGPLELLITHAISLLMAAVLVTLATRSIEDSLAVARQERERFFKAFNLSPLRMGILRVRDGVVLDVNACWVRDMGFAREAIVGRSIFEQKSWIGEEMQRIRQILQEGQPIHNWEGLANTKDGEKRNILMSAEPIELSGERCFLWVATDITDRKRAEEALRESEQLFRTSFENATAGVCLVGTDGSFLSVNQTMCDMLGYSRSEFEQLSFNAVTHDEDKDIGAAFVENALSGDVNRAHFEKRYLHKDGHTIWAYVSSTLVRQPGIKRHYFISYLQDITDRKRAETERLSLTHDLGERVKELTALHGTARLLQEERPFDKELLSELVALLPPAWQYPEVCVARITYADLDVQTPGWRETLWQQTASFVTRAGEQGMIAVGYVEERPPDKEGPFLAEERNLIESLADMLGTHLERKRAEEQIRETSEQLRALMASLRSAKEEEGVRIAREIHDELGSALTGLRWDLEEIAKAVSRAEAPAFPPALRGKIDTMFGLIDGTIQGVRRISSELRPSILDDLGLGAAVEWQAQQFQARTGIACRYVCSVENVDLDTEQGTSVFRIFQEALTNVLRHAEATRVDVSLEEEGDEFLLTIRDDGKGIREGEKASPSALGLLGMRERAHLIGGRVDIAGVEGKGTTVTLRVPLSHSRAFRGATP